MYSARASKANISIKPRHSVMKNEGCLLRREREEAEY